MHTATQHIGNQHGERTLLLKQIVPIVLQKGLKSTTMDYVAGRLGMSKRTLYELFSSKSDMIKEVMEEMARQNRQVVADAFASTENVMEAMISIFKHNRDAFGKINISFFRDMDRLYKDKRQTYDESGRERHEQMQLLFEKGVKQGMFRKDVDYRVQSRIMGIQMESLKRMEELFPPDISFVRVFDAIIVGFLRSIASEKGMKILDTLTQDLTHPE